jgi:hypothetical protein
MRTRVQYLRRTCSENLWTSPSIDWKAKALRDRMFIVDDQHKVMYCMIPKAATHTFRVLLGELAVGKLSGSL